MAPIFLNGFGLNQFSGTIRPASTCSFDDRVLVIIYLAGANDIINTAVPLNQFGQYEQNRPTIKLPENNLITLNDSVDPWLSLGLHPNLQGLKNLYEDDKLCLLQRVGYPTPNRSHFASEDIMLKGIDGDEDTEAEKNGWIGRFLKDKHPAYKGLPFGDFLDPLGIILGNTPDTGFHTLDEHDMEINLSGQDPAGFFNVLSSLSGQPITEFPNSNHGEMLRHIALVDKSTQVYSERIQDVFNVGTNTVNYTNEDNEIYDLSNQLRTIAKFISGGSTTKVYMARIGGWDTHVNQLNKQSALLKELGFSLEKFQLDLQQLNVDHKVITTVFSEFSRKLLENGNEGTDHGTLSSMFVIGSNVNTDHSESSTYEGNDYLVDQGIFGINQDLANYLGGAAAGPGEGGAANPTQLQHDYRSVFASILRDWLGASSDSIQASFPSTDASILNRNLPIIGTSSVVDSTCPYVQITAATINLSIKVFLEGFYDSATGLMTNNLNQAGSLPSGQPFDNIFFNYFGSEVSANQLPAKTVDWVLIELYDTNGLRKRRIPALLDNDGFVTNLDGSKPLEIDELYPEEHQVAVLHRSHLGVLVKAGINVIDGANYTLNLTTATELVEGSNQLKNLALGVYGLIAGDLDNNGVINTTDFGNWRREIGSSGYYSGDMNADGTVDFDDSTLWKNNRSKIGSPVLHKHLKGN